MNYKRVSSPKIEVLELDEIFVFGSNLGGIHGGGAARLAYQRFGAAWGYGEGMAGCTYAIPTKDKNIETLPLEKISPYVDNFINYANAAPQYLFLVTEIGCGLAGYAPKDIAPMFQRALLVDNIFLPDSFHKVLEDFVR